MRFTQSLKLKYFLKLLLWNSENLTGSLRHALQAPRHSSLKGAPFFPASIDILPIFISLPVETKKPNCCTFAGTNYHENTADYP